jgi:hypothetical protein
MGRKPVCRVEALLDDLCVRHGYCLSPDQQAALIEALPEDVDAFVDAVLRAEGMDPASADKQSRLSLSELVRDWFIDEGQGTGTRSGLPLLPPSSPA